MARTFGQTLKNIESNISSILNKFLSLISVNAHTGNEELRVYLENHICLDNTTNIPLGAGEIFTGEWQDALNYVEIRVSVITDQNSAIDGLEIQWSDDGVTLVDGVEDNYTVLANKGKAFSTPRNWRYFRIIYSNGLVAQSRLQLTTQVDRFASKGSAHRIKDSIVADDDAILTKSVITGERDDGVFGNATLDNANHLMVNAQPYLYSVAEGDVAGHSSLLKFGTRSAIAANTQSVIWEGTNALYTYLTSAEQLKISSSSANDTVAGTGARTFTIVGLDANFLEQTETVNLNGVTAVTTTKSFIRVFRGYCETVGTFGGTNAGNINVTNNAGTNQLMYIPAGDGQTLMTMWTVPAGKVAYITRITASNDSGKGARFSLFTRKLDGGVFYPWNIKYRAYLVGGNEPIPYDIPFKIPEKTDIEIRFTTPTAAGTTSGGSTFELWYEDV